MKATNSRDSFISFYCFAPMEECGGYITDLHNSNMPLVQVTLSGEELVEERFFLLGFVAGKDIKIEENVWFSELTVFQICLLDEVLAKKQYS